MGQMKELLLITIFGGGDEAVAAVESMGKDWREQLEHAADEVERLREEQRWIPVEERLPEQECRCLLVIRGEVMSATYYPPGKFQPGITHWMGLPLPPEVTP